MVRSQGNRGAHEGRKTSYPPVAHDPRVGVASRRFHLWRRRDYAVELRQPIQGAGSSIAYRSATPPLCLWKRSGSVP